MRTAKCTDGPACCGGKIALASAAFEHQVDVELVRTPHYPASVETWSTNHCRGIFAMRVDPADFVRFGSITVTGDVAPSQPGRSQLARPAALIAPATAVWRKTRNDTGLENREQHAYVAVTIETFIELAHQAKMDLGWSGQTGSLPNPLQVALRVETACPAY